MALNELTLNIADGIKNRAYAGVVGGLTAGSSLTIEPDCSPGFWTANGLVYNSRLPLNVSNVGLRETKDLESRTTRIDINTLDDDGARAFADALIPSGRTLVAFEPAAYTLDDGSLIWSIIAYDDQGARYQAELSSGSGGTDPNFNDGLIAPVLNLAAAGNVYPPQIDAALDVVVIVGDVLRVQASLGSGFGAMVFDVAHVITGPEAVASAALLAQLATITSPQQTFFRARIERGTAFGPWSNTVKHGDIVAPVITSNASPSYAERAPLVHLLTANEQVSWSIFGGSDYGLLELSGANLRLSGNAELDFEAKASYAVTVRATDLAGLTTDQALTIAVVNVDEVPDAIVFTPVANAARSAVITSNTVAVSGLAAGVSLPVTVTGGTWSKNGGAFGAAAGVVTNADTVAVRLNSSASYSTLASASLSVGGFVSDFNVTTLTDPANVQWAPTYPPAAQNIGYLSGSATFAAVTFAAGIAVVQVAWSGDGTGNTLGSVTIGGAAATIYSSGGPYGAAIAIVPAITAGSHNVVCTMNSGTISNIAITTGTITNAEPVPASSLTVPFNSVVADPQQVGPLTIPANGIALVAFGSLLGTSDAIWTSANEDATAANANIMLSTAHTRVSGTVGVTGTPTALSYQGNSFAAVVLEPL